MFRTQNNVPEIYPVKSRDFQMFCRLFDVAFNSVKQSIDSMEQITSTQYCDATLLPLLKDKLGFFTKLDLSDQELRYVLQAFPIIIRYKGSWKSVKYVLNLYTRLVASITESSLVEITDNDSEYRVEISSPKAIVKSDLLLDLLTYVLPTGYRIDYFVTEKEVSITWLYTASSLIYNDEPEINKRAVIVMKEDLNAISKYTQEAQELPHIVNMTSIVSEDTIS